MLYLLAFSHTTDNLISPVNMQLIYMMPASDVQDGFLQHFLEQYSRASLPACVGRCCVPDHAYSIWSDIP